MLNPTINKLLIINPTEEEMKSLKLLAAETVLTDLVKKVFLMKSNDEFTPRLMGEREVRRFISNVKPTIIPIQDFINEELKDMAEARQYLAKLGKEIYGDAWFINLIKNEIEFGEEKTYGIVLGTMESIAQMSRAMEFFVAYRVNYPQGAPQQVQTPAPTVTASGATPTKRQLAKMQAEAEAKAKAEAQTQEQPQQQTAQTQEEVEGKNNEQQ